MKKSIICRFMCCCLLALLACFLLGCESEKPKKENNIPTASESNVGGKDENTTNGTISNFQIIYETITRNNNRIVIGNLLSEDIVLTTKNNQIHICVSADSYSNNLINQTKENLEIALLVSINSNGRGTGACEYLQWKQRCIDHQYQYVSNVETSAKFDVKIDNIGDSVDYRDYNIYYDKDGTYSYDRLSKEKSYYNTYVSLCKEQYVQAIIELALESFNIIVNG